MAHLAVDLLSKFFRCEFAARAPKQSVARLRRSGEPFAGARSLRRCGMQRAVCRDVGSVSLGFTASPATVCRSRATMNVPLWKSVSGSIFRCSLSSETPARSVTKMSRSWPSRCRQDCFTQRQRCSKFGLEGRYGCDSNLLVWQTRRSSGRVRLAREIPAATFSMSCF